MSELRTIASPCVNVCRVNRRKGLCEGCFRTLAEIAAWPTATDNERRAILAQVKARR